MAFDIPDNLFYEMYYNKKKLMDKPDRDIPINGDDILNLKIALNTSNSIDDFLEKV